MTERISYTIEKVCKHLGIDYKSKNLEDKQTAKDAIRLGKCYTKLKRVAGELLEISERHQIDGLGEWLEKEIEMIERCDHDIAQIASIIKEKENV